MASEATLTKRENRLVDQHGSILGTCRGAAFLCLALFAVAFLLAGQDGPLAGSGMWTAQMSVAFLLVAWIMDAKLKHIRTIHRYRAMSGANKADEGA